MIFLLIAFSAKVESHFLAEKTSHSNINNAPQNIDISGMIEVGIILLKNILINLYFIMTF